MSFILFIIYYFICTIILLFLIFLLYKIYFKKIIDEKFALNTLDGFFKNYGDKSILDVNLPKNNTGKENNDNDNEIHTFF